MTQTLGPSQLKMHVRNKLDTRRQEECDRKGGIKANQKKELMKLQWDSENLFCKSPDKSILGFEGHIVTITAQFCCYTAKAK